MTSTAAAPLASILRDRQTVAHRMLGELRAVALREDWPAAYRQKLAAELIATIRSTNAKAEQDARETAVRLARPLAARLAEGVAYTADERAEAALLAQQYAGNPRMLDGIIRSALEAGAVSRARAAYRARTVVSGAVATPLGGDPLAEVIEGTDAEMLAAKARLAEIEALYATLRADIAAERAAVLPDGPEKVGAVIDTAEARYVLGIPPIERDGRSALDIVAP